MDVHVFGNLTQHSDIIFHGRVRGANLHIVDMFIYYRRDVLRSDRLMIQRTL